MKSLGVLTWCCTLSIEVLKLEWWCFKIKIGIDIPAINARNTWTNYSLHWGLKSFWPKCSSYLHYYNIVYLLKQTTTDILLFFLFISAWRQLEIVLELFVASVLEGQYLIDHLQEPSMGYMYLHYISSSIISPLVNFSIS